MGTYAMTGGATGIGAAIKNRLRKEGNEVIVIDIKGADIEADLSSAEGRAKANTELAQMAAEGLEGFIACAGVGTHVSPISLIPRVNYFGAVASIESARELVAKKRGSVVIVSSQAAVHAHDPAYLELLAQGKEAEACNMADTLNGQLAYAGGKRALTYWMRKHCAEYAAQGVRMNAIAPGYTDTPLTAAAITSPEFTDAIEKYKSSIPVGFAGTPEDQAAAACFLLSDDARYICGTMLFVDGGTDALSRPTEF